MTNVNELKPIIFVSSLYDIYKKPEQVQFYLKQFDILANNPISIIIFCDKTYYDLLPEYENVTKIHKELDEFVIYKILTMNTLKLPGSRSANKDTMEFLALMNVKLDFLKEAHAISQNKFLCWIDAGIMKITKDTKKVCEYISAIHPNVKTGVIIPGCWNRERDVPENEVCWRFAGGFLIVHRDFMVKFYQQIFQTINLYVSKYQKTTWEVNIWALMEKQYPDNIYWFKADHNDSMFFIPKELLHTSIKIINENKNLYDVIKSFINAKSIHQNTSIPVHYNIETNRYNQIFKESIIHPSEKFALQEYFFTNRLLALNNEEICSNTKHITPLQLIKDKSQIINEFQTNELFDYQYENEKINTITKNRIIQQINYLKNNINDMIIENINLITQRINQPSLGVYIPKKVSTMDNPYKRFEKDIYSKPIQEYLKMNQVKSIVLYCEESEDEVFYRNMFSTYPILYANHDKWNPIQKQINQLLIFSYCSTLISKRSSNFTDLSFWFSNCSQKIIPVL